PSRVYGLAFSPDGRTLATAGNEGVVKLWEVPSGKLSQRLFGHAGMVFGLAFSPDGKWLATAGQDRTARVWDVKTCREVTPRPLLHVDSVYAVAFSPNGTLLVTGTLARETSVWDVARGVAVRTFRGHTAAVSAVTFSPD